MSSFQHLSVAELKTKIHAGESLQLVDIRDAASFAAGHIPGAFNLNNDNLADYIRDADMDQPLVVICYHGISSQGASTYLVEQGFDQVFSLDGGFQSWQDNR
ncbi:MAG: thiosulfate sulfurtransferase GlpE [Shewanella sp.]|nr:thiosulfate sulfurtransferase GlpE [Shewanella sp.]MCF1457507.1 thiosulfate sulfurtransferase GlpE [Shewanella sp.]